MEKENRLVIESMDVCIVGDCFKMKLETDRKKLKASDFKCCMYAEDYFMMCNGIGDDVVKAHGGTLEITLQSRFLWLPGSYSLLFEMTGAIMGSMDFTVDETLHPECCALTQAGTFEAEDVALSFLASNVSWEALTNLPGTRELRQEVIDMSRLRLWRRAVALDIRDDARQPSGYVFTCKGDEKPVMAIRCFYMAMCAKSDIEVVDSATLYDAALQNPLDGFNQLLNDTARGTTICLDRVGALSGTGGRTIMKKLTEALRQGRYGLWLCGTQQELDTLFDMYPSLREFFPDEKHLSLHPSTLLELTRRFFYQLKAWDLHPDSEASKMLTDAIRRGYNDGTITHWTTANINRFYQEKVLKAYLSRLADTASSFAKDELRTEDIDYSGLYGHASDFEVCLEELNRMIGLDNVKKSIATIAHQVKIFAERREHGLPTSGKEVYHAVFTGSPGTGKTTVAKMLGTIFHRLGVLSKGEVITVDRSRLVGRFIGDTEDNVRNVLKEARGNVLFIDEAYTLYGSEGSNDFGRRAIECLLTSLSVTNPDMLVIFAGYKEEMDRLMTMNPGLYDRFPYKLHFSDYSAEQLIQIAEHLFAQDEYLLTDEAHDELRRSIGKIVKERSKHFGNARWVEQFVRNGIIPALADRLAITKAVRPLEREDYQQVEAADIRSAYELFAPHIVELKPRLRVVGFAS